MVSFFLFRLMIFAGAIYGSLKCFQGSAVALLCGLGLAVIAIGWEVAAAVTRLRPGAAIWIQKDSSLHAESLAITRLLNHLFGGIVASLMHAVGLPANPESAINDTFALELLVAAGLIAFFVLVRLTLSVEKPKRATAVR